MKNKKDKNSDISLFFEAEAVIPPSERELFDQDVGRVKLS
jgi:hypothetical protein